MDGRNYGFMEWSCDTVSTVATNINRNILLNSTYSTSVPPKFNSYKHTLLRKSANIINLKDDTGSTWNYIRDKDTIIFKNLQPKTYNHRPPSPPPWQHRYPTNTFLIFTSLNVTPTSHTNPRISKYQEHYPPFNMKTLKLWFLWNFHKKDVTVFNSDNTHVLNIKRNTYDGLLDITITSSQP